MDEQKFQRGERVATIFNLVDACNRCGLAFRLASERIANVAFSHYAGELRQILDRFSFELLTETRRIDGGDFGPPRAYTETTDEPNELRDRCDSTFREMMDAYATAGKSSLPAHARAMIKRQSTALELMAARFADVYRATA